MTLTAPPELLLALPADRRRWRVPVLPLIVALVFLSGVVTVMYPTAAAWVHQKNQSQMLVEMGGELEQLPPAGLDREIELAHRYNDLLTGGATVGSWANLPQAEGSSSGDLPDYRNLLHANATGMMARVRIPAIDVDLPIYHGTSDAVLMEGVGHLQGTALPVGGPSTHSVLTAHRGLASAEMFTNLDEVQVGDTFTVETFGEVLTYQVRQTQVVDPSETEKLYPLPGADLITLVTCTPLGINTQRILVTGERVTPTPIEDLRSAGQVPDIPGFPWWAVIVGGSVLVLGGYVYLMGRPRRPRPVVPA